MEDFLFCQEKKEHEVVLMKFGKGVLWGGQLTQNIFLDQLQTVKPHLILDKR